MIVELIEKGEAVSRSNSPDYDPARYISTYQEIVFQVRVNAADCVVMHLMRLNDGVVVRINEKEFAIAKPT